MRDVAPPKRADTEDCEGPEVPVGSRFENVIRHAPSEVGRAVDIDQLVLMVAMVRADLRYRCVNTAYAEWLGRDRAQIEGKFLSEVLPEDVLGQIAPFIDRVLGGECVTHEIAFRPHVGGRRTYLSAMCPTRMASSPS